MENELLSFKYNCCRIDVKVAGSEAKASGFIYKTKPNCDYDYVVTAKHTFQEEKDMPNIGKLDNLEIRWMIDNDRLDLFTLDKQKYKSDIMFFDEYDLAIIRIPKQLLPKAKRIAVRNMKELSKNNNLETHSFPVIKRSESTTLEFKILDGERGTIQAGHIKDIRNYEGVSGSGVYCCEEPFLVGVLVGYRLPGCEQDEFRVALVNWDRVNELLHKKGWTRLNQGSAKNTCITTEKEVIDIRELCINGANLNMESAINKLRHDMTDDWYFDPLHYVDMCNKKFVMDYFSSKEHRNHYKPEKMEVFYLPKKSFVLRKAMVGTFVDRLIYTAVVNELAATIDSHLSQYVFSARYNMTSDVGDGMIVNGVEQWTKMNYLIESWIKDTSKGCIVRLDLLNYYDTINKQMLIRLLREIVVDENEKDCVTLLESMLNGFAKDDEGHGIPQNCDASSLLATFYVSHIDELVQDKALHYCRFMDDMYFMAKDVYEARDLLQAIEKHLRSIDLSVNAQKVKFIKLNDEEEKMEFIKELSLYDHEKTKIKHLIKSNMTSRRMNAISLLINQLGKAFNPQNKNMDKDSERALKFAGHAFSSYKLELSSYWTDFYKDLVELVKGIVDAPDNTPLVCRLVASIRKSREMDEVKDEIASLVLRKKGGIYEWQAYHIWMLLAFFKYETPELIRFAAEEIEKNAETKTVEVAAIFIYMVTLRPEYARILLHRLRDNQLHGNLQKRCALIAMRALDPNAIDEVAIGELCEQLKMCHHHLHENKESSLVFFHQVSSHPLAQNESVLFPEYYSGL